MLFRRRMMKPLMLIVLLLAQIGSFAQVTADFTTNRTSGCSPLIVQFTDLSTGPVTSWNWNFGNGNISNQKNPGAIYVAPGIYNVRLIVSNGVSSDTMLKTAYITVFQNPSPAIAADVTQGCNPLTVNFSDNSTPGSAPLVTWIWDFGDGNTSTLQNPSHTFINSGSFNITLSLIDSNGCVANGTFNNFILVDEIPVAGFGSDINSGCFPPLTVNFADSSSPSSGLNYLWDFGDGTTSTTQHPTHTYVSLGTFDVKLRVSSTAGCKDSLTISSYIDIEDLVADFTANVVKACAGQPIQFTDLSTSSPSTWQWDFGDGGTAGVKNPSYTYMNPGTYTVQLIAANSGSCADTAVKTGYIEIDPSPTASFTSDATQACAPPLTVNFTDQSSGATSWLWDFGDGTTDNVQNPTHTFTTVDTFSVTLTVSNAAGCPSAIAVASTIMITPPRVMFDAQGRYGCAPRTVDFRDSSLSINPIVSWLWDFGDSSTSAVQHPTHIYNTPGNYHVALTITDSAGCTATLIDSNFVGAGDTPTVAFSANPLVVCNYDPVAFTNNSVGSTSWHWEFGDGGESDEFEPVYTYSDTGRFDVKLVVRDRGCPDSLQIDDYIYVSPPDAAFTENFNCISPDSVVFVDNSLAPDTWFWDFGDGNTDTVPSPTHVYPGRGSYHVILTCTSNLSNCVDVEEHDIVITDPVADFIGAPTYGCRPLTVTFTDISQDAVAWNWQTGGMSSTLQNPNFTYNTPGTYDVMLVVTDIHGCSDTLVKTAYVTVTGPTADFSSNPLTGCAPLVTQFLDLSTTYLTPITNWYWNFGDGTSSTLQNPSHTYSSTGYYTVSLTVTDSDNCQHTTTKVNFIQPTFPVPDFSADTLSCTTRGVQFVNMSVGVGMSFLWDFGDGYSSTAANPVHLYANEGIYTIALTVTDVNGCDSTLVKPNYVRIADPTANFGADTTFAPCPPLLVNFIDSSGDAVSWRWNFGDGASSTLRQPSHVYTAPGSYDVTLVVTSALGCSDTLFRDDYIRVNGPNGTFTFTPSIGCLGQQVDFAAVTVNTASRTWDFGDGTIQAAGDTVSHIYNTSGIYHPIIILDDGMGCIYAVSSPDSILIGEVTPDFIAGKVNPCAYEPVQFTDLTTGYPTVMSRLWDFGDGNTSSLQNPTHFYDSAGYYDVSLIAYNGICYDTMTKQQYIYVTPYPQADFAMSVNSGCVGTGVNFTDISATDTTTASWAWNFGDGGADSIANPSHVFNTTGSYNVQLIVWSSIGCSDTASKSIAVYSLPVAYAGPDTTECEGTAVQFNGSGGASYSWFPAAGLDNPNAANPFATPGDTTNYILTVTDTNNCQDTDTMTFFILPVPVVSVISDMEICTGDTSALWASGGLNYLWSPASSLDCDTCSNPNVFPDTTTLYIVHVTNGYQCDDYDSVLVTVRERPVGIITPDTAFCYGGSAQLESRGGITHSWSPASTLSCSNCSNPVATPDSTTIYTLQVFNQYNCEMNDSVTVTVYPLPNITIQSQDICEGDTTQIFSSGGAIYNWTPAAGLSCSNCPNPFAFPGVTTTYQLEVISSDACVNYDSTTIRVMLTPEVYTIEDVTICNGDEVTLTTTYVSTDSVNWNPVDGIKS
ncbi:MAG TPA: PKD domain-containing protein, partial [Chitinophagales bacterium]|nr:PKD domain-containing protein [Chitinophagales bacterium]